MCLFSEDCKSQRMSPLEELCKFQLNFFFLSFFVLSGKTETGVASVLSRPCGALCHPGSGPGLRDEGWQTWGRVSVCHRGDRNELPAVVWLPVQAAPSALAMCGLQSVRYAFG